MNLFLQVDDPKYRNRKIVGLELATNCNPSKFSNGVDDIINIYLDRRLITVMVHETECNPKIEL
jgi:hypothetical protein